MHLSIMIKPASSLCNLRCRYCFYHDLAENRRVASYGVMQEDTLRRLLSRAFEAFPALGRHTLSLIFQGGEPMLAGLAFFETLEQLLAAMKRADVQVQRSVQTNGTLIDDAWARFFRQHGYLLGVSLDGYADIHNALRPDAQGKGSFNRTMRGIDCLKKHGVAFNILTVVTAPVAQHGRKVYGFLRKHGWDYLQFIPCMDPLDGQRTDYQLTAAQYGRFLVEIFEEYEREWLQGQGVSVRFFDNLIDLAAGNRPESCGMTGICACQFVVEADGSVYPCDFYVDDAHRLGTIWESSLQAMFEGETARAFVQTSLQRAAACEQCAWFRLCRGGCRRYRGETDGQLGLNQLCPAFQMFFDACGSRILHLASLRRWGGRG